MSEATGDDQASQDRISPESQTHQLFREAVDKRVEEVRKEYLGKTIINDPEIENPVKQSRNDKAGRTCLIAVARNVMKALGAKDIPTEEEVLKIVTKDNPLDSEGEIRLAPVLDYLETQGFKKSEEPLWGYPKKLIEGLLAGGVVIEVIPAEGGSTGSHAKLLSGIRIEEGNIWLREYDPDPRKPISQLVPLDQHLKEDYKSLTLLVPKAE